MFLARIFISGRRQVRLNCSLQVLLLIGFWLAGEEMSRLTQLQVPGSIFGLVLVLLLLLFKVISLRTISRGAHWFLSEMLLFFVPAAMIIMDHPEFFRWQGLKALGVILIGTLIVMTVTGVVIELCLRLQMRKKVHA